MSADADPLRGSTILLVDDEPANLDLLQGILEDAGCAAIVRTTDAREAVALRRASGADLVLLDLHMPHRNGFEVLADLRADTPADEHLPVLVLTADATFRAKQQALSGGASDFLTKPFVNAEVVLRARSLLQLRRLYEQQRRARRTAELLDDASELLHESLDGATAGERLAHLLVPRLADVCRVMLADEQTPPGRRTPADAWAHLGAEPAVTLLLPLLRGDVGVGQLALGRHDAARPFADDEVALALELTRRLAHAVERARLYREARTAVEARDQVLAIVAHDLRSPLCALRLDAELLQEKLAVHPLRPFETRALARLHDTAARMDGLIEDLLDVARVDRGLLALDRVPRDVGAVVAEASDALRAYVASHALTLDVVMPDSPLPADVDAARLTQVVANLVGNAVKFTPAGGTVTVRAARVHDEVRLTVTDTGAGIAAEQLPHVFGAFWQARHADRRGLGLGLAIARGIVEAHGGRIWVESPPGAGATFTCAFPTATGSDAAPTLASEARRSLLTPHPMTTTPPTRVLVVEDTREIAEALQDSLEAEGYAVALATKAAHALALAASHRPSLVILDLGLPDRDGHEVLRELRQRGSEVPVLILSARREEADKLEGFRLGADDYVTKPFSRPELLARLSALLRRARPVPVADPAPTGVARLTDDEVRARYGLTPRQVTVARLLAEGRSNAEIAEALDMSFFTARNHAEQVLRRLGVPTRAAVGAMFFTEADPDA